MDIKDRLEVDQRMYRKLLKEFKGKVITHVCPSCRGTRRVGVGKNHEFNEPCYECGGKGEIPIQW